VKKRGGTAPSSFSFWSDWGWTIFQRRLGVFFSIHFVLRPKRARSEESDKLGGFRGRMNVVRRGRKKKKNGLHGDFPKKVSSEKGKNPGCFRAPLAAFGRAYGSGHITITLEKKRGLQGETGRGKAFRGPSARHSKPLLCQLKKIPDFHRGNGSNSLWANSFCCVGGPQGGPFQKNGVKGTFGGGGTI